MKKIPLTKGKFAIVDDEDFEFVSRLKPQAMRREFNKGLNRTYSKTWEVILPGAKNVNVYYVKHMLLRPGNTNCLVEAKNGNNLDIRKENLILIPREISLHHNIKRKGTTSKYKGVCFIKKEKALKKWCAYITRGGKRKHIGVFYTQNEAAEAYNEKAKELYGELAYQNKIN
jgi:hypothetical protein